MESVKPLFVEEEKTFEANKEELLKLCEGKYAVIKGSELFGVYDTPGAAYEAAVDKWGDELFMIKRVEREETVEQVTRLYMLAVMCSATAS